MCACVFMCVCVSMDNIAIYQLLSKEGRFCAGSDCRESTWSLRMGLDTCKGSLDVELG